MRDHRTRFDSIRHYAVGLLALGLFGPAAQAQDDKIELVCSGEGSALKTQTTYINEYNRHRHRYEFGSAQTMGRQEFSGSAYVEISGRFARMKVPRGMLPGIHSTDKGWSDVQDLFVDDREITGKVRLNGLNKPRFRIDRTTGTIEIGDNFSGRCDPVDRSAGPRF